MLNSRCLEWRRSCFEVIARHTNRASDVTRTYVYRQISVIKMMIYYYIGEKKGRKKCKKERERRVLLFLLFILFPQNCYARSSCGNYYYYFIFWRAGASFLLWRGVSVGPDPMGEEEK